MATGWAPLKSPPPVVPSLGPFRETKTISGTGFFTCLAGLTSTDRPTFHPSVTRVSETPFSRIPSLSYWVGGSHGLWVLGLAPPSDFEIGDAHFKADCYYSLRKS